MNNLIRHQIALLLVDGLGAQKASMLLSAVKKPEDIFQSPDKVFKRLPGIGTKIIGRIRKFDKWDLVDQILEKTEKGGWWLISQADEEYPEALRHIHSPPLLLWGMGDRNILNDLCFAVIGTRRPSSYGKEAAQFFSEKIVEKGFTIISGLALGIDTIAHQSAVKFNKPTIAVLGSGIDVIYPAENKKLVEKIVDTGGAVISEFPLGRKPDAPNFPTRNRVVSGMSKGVLVVESELTGGSMITANLALEQGREVFVVPHTIKSKRGMGCNSLIKSGAGKLVMNEQDIFEEFSALMVVEKENGLASPTPDMSKLSEFQKKLVEFIGSKELHIDELSEGLNKPTHELLVDLLDLEMDGFIKALQGKRFTTIS